MRPGEHGRHNQADAFAAARRRVTQDMLGANRTETARE